MPSRLVPPELSGWMGCNMIEGLNFQVTCHILISCVNCAGGECALLLLCQTIASAETVSLTLARPKVRALCAEQKPEMQNQLYKDEASSREANMLPKAPMGSMHSIGYVEPPWT
eukprot:1079825-Amphidinium_carterae.1